jgi:hypothetical protein
MPTTCRRPDRIVDAFPGKRQARSRSRSQLNDLASEEFVNLQKCRRA